jgi:hypothetical protein
VRPHANSRNCKKCIFTQNYIAILAFFVISIGWLCNPLPAYANNQFVCYALVNNGNRITSIYTGAYMAGSSAFNNRPVSLALVRDFCHDSGTAGYSIGGYYGLGQNAATLATRAITLPATTDYTDHIQSWNMSEVADRLGCAASRGRMGFPGINQVISMLPQSPENMRIPTLITRISGENSLAGNLAIELYSGVWQFLGILTSFKLFKVFFRGG